MILALLLVLLVVLLLVVLLVVVVVEMVMQQQGQQASTHQSIVLQPHLRTPLSLYCPPQRCGHYGSCRSWLVCLAQWGGP
jgi:hypothetical protein